MAHEKFQVEVLTPEGEVFNDEVEMVSTRTATGSIGVLAHHAPVLAMLDPTELRLYTSENDVTSFAQAEGYRPITPFVNGLAHFHNQAYNTGRNVLDPEHPQELIYLKMRTGEMKLVGIMYLMPPGAAGPVAVAGSGVVVVAVSAVFIAVIKDE